MVLMLFSLIVSIQRISGYCKKNWMQTRISANSSSIWPTRAQEKPTLLPLSRYRRQQGEQNAERDPEKGQSQIRLDGNVRAPSNRTLNQRSTLAQRRFDAIGRAHFVWLWPSERVSLWSGVRVRRKRNYFSNFFPTRICSKIDHFLLGP